MKTPEILHCSSCNKPLNEFETGKWNDLVDYWGGNIGSRLPKCRTCYLKYIQEARERTTI